MKDKKPLEKYEAIRFIGPVLMHNLESGMLFDGNPKKATVEDVNGTRICISFDPSAFEKSGNTVIGYIDRRQITHRIRPRPAKEERERVGERTERWIVTSYNGASWWIYSTKEQAEASRKNDVGDFRVARVVEIFPGEVLVDRAKLEEKWKRVVSSHINFRDQSPDMPVCQALAAALGLPAKGQP